MATDIVLGLNGQEIITDIIDQVRTALSKDCNLRPADSYGFGYEGTVEIKLKCRALDVTEVNVTTELRPSPKVQKLAQENPLSEEDQKTAKDVEIKETITIPLEANLNAVRERSGQGVPMESVGGGQSEIQKRTYTEVQGGALEAPEGL